MRYEMLTGRVPFDGDTPLAIVRQHINAVPLPPSEIADSVPKGMDDIVMKAMCPVLSKRYVKAADVYNDLEKLKHQPSIRLDTAASRQTAVDGETVVLPKLNEEIKREQEKVLRTEPVTPPHYERKLEEKPVRTRKKGFFGKLIESPVAMAILGVLLCVAIAGVAIVKMMGLGGELILVPRFVDSNVYDILNNEEYQNQFVFEQQYQVNNEVDPGTILDQSPTANESVKLGATIVLTVAEYAQPETPPVETYVIDDLTGESLQLADIILRKNGIKYELERQASLDVEKDHVVATIPASGTSIAKDEVITVVVSLGPEGIPVMVPNLLGSTLSEAQTMLADAHLEVKVKTKKSDAPENQVIEQSIESETEVDAGTVVEITISLGSGTVLPPHEPSQPTETPNDEPIQIPGMSDPEGSGEASISFRLPADEGSAHVVVYVDGVQVHEQIYDTSDQHRVSLDLTAARGDRMVYIDINGERDERIVKFR
jgi:serine/threonine-protein kinase